LLQQERAHQLHLKGYEKESRIIQTERNSSVLNTEKRLKKGRYSLQKKKSHKNSPILIEPNTPYEKQVEIAPDAKHSKTQTVVSVLQEYRLELQ
jgi:hypothetical protein